LTRTQVLHFKEGLDFILEELNFGSNDDEVVDMNVDKTDPGCVLMDEDTGVNGLWQEIDGGEELLEAVVPTARALLKSVEGFLELETVTLRELNAHAVGYLDEEVFNWDPIQKSSLHVHLLDVVVVHSH
jgi:hypothetical protein